MSDFRFTRPNSFPPIIKNIIIINVLVYLAQSIFDSTVSTDRKADDSANPFLISSKMYLQRR